MDVNILGYNFFVMIPRPKKNVKEETPIENTLHILKIDFASYWRNRLRRCETIEDYEIAVEALLSHLSGSCGCTDSCSH